jgi:hypothetical protein
MINNAGPRRLRLAGVVLTDGAVKAGERRSNAVVSGRPGWGSPETGGVGDAVERSEHPARDQPAEARRRTGHHAERDAALSEQ